MPRVNRSLVLPLLISISCVYLLFQVFYYRKYVSKPPLLRSGQLTSSDSQWQTVRTFLQLAQRYDLPLFLADSASLQRITHNALLQTQTHSHTQHKLTSDEPNCHFLCTDRPITAFALLANRWKYDPSFLSAAEQNGFRFLEIRGSDPRLGSLDSLSGGDIPLYFLFTLNSFTIQVVFLYERSSYLWFGSVRLHGNADRGFCPFKQMAYGRHAGAMDKPTLLPTVLDGLSVKVPQNVSAFILAAKNSHFLECRYRDARNFLQKYPDDSSPSSLDFRIKVKSLLQLAVKIFGKLNVPFWISSGTCLGWFRQCAVISYSKDVDVGVFIDDYRDDIIEAFKGAGLRLKHKFGKVSDSLELSFLSQQEVKLDVFFFYKQKEVYWNGGTQARTGRKYKYIFPPFSLCWAELMDIKLRVPCETLDYITANYGSDWSIPVRHWDWKTSAANVMTNGVWPVREWEQVIQVY